MYEYHYGENDEYVVSISTEEEWSNDETVITSYTLEIVHNDEVVYTEEEYLEPDFDVYDKDDVARYLAQRGQLSPTLQRDALLKERARLEHDIAGLQLTLNAYHKSVGDALGALNALGYDAAFTELVAAPSVHAHEGTQPVMATLATRLSSLCFTTAATLKAREKQLADVNAKLATLPRTHSDQITQLLLGHD